MANVAPARVTITSTTGPGVSATSTVFNNVVDLEFDFNKNTIKITHANGLTISYYDYSAIATLTWTITAGATVIVIS